MKALRQRKAFTIVEMVIVIAVIAVLATVMIPTISGVIDKANHSVDQQFAASLNTQLALWELDNHKIANEKDLSDAINQYYGKYNDEGDLVDDFYSKLEPKSGEQGYHYWYNATDNQFVLATYEQLKNGESKTLEATQLMPEILLLLEGNVMPLAAGEPEDHERIVFAAESPRSLLIETAKGHKKNVFLLDNGGSELADVIHELEHCSGKDADEYENLINKIKAE